MTYKERAIQACKNLAGKYMKPQGKVFFKGENCGFCDIYFDAFEFRYCKGCPFAKTSGKVGCIQFNTYKKASVYLGLNTYKYPKDLPTHKTFIMAAKFLEKIIPILEKIPKERFTPSGWTYFNELNRDW